MTEIKYVMFSVINRLGVGRERDYRDRRGKTNTLPRLMLSIIPPPPDTRYTNERGTQFYLPLSKSVASTNDCKANTSINKQAKVKHS